MMRYCINVSMFFSLSWPTEDKTEREKFGEIERERGREGDRECERRGDRKREYIFSDNIEKNRKQKTQCEI